MDPPVERATAGRRPEERASPGTSGVRAGQRVGPGYNARAVERLTAVPATTFRAWERRYGVPAPRRLTGGRRIYDEHDVAIVRWVRERTDQGVAVSLAIAQLRHSPGILDSGRQPSFPFPDLVAAIVRAALAFDAAGVEQALSGALAAHSLEAVCLDVIEPVLAELAAHASAGEGSPAAGHFATILLRRRLERLAALLGHGTERPLVVLGAAPGEHDETNLSILGLLLRQRGQSVVALGADVPVEAAVEVSRRLRPDLVCLAAAGVATAHTLRYVAQALATVEPSPAFAFFGPAFRDAPSLAGHTPGTFLGPDTRQALLSVQRLLHPARTGAPDP
jgi:methanogenic corrinoid protein MtbC1